MSTEESFKISFRFDSSVWFQSNERNYGYIQYPILHGRPKIVFEMWYVNGLLMAIRIKWRHSNGIWSKNMLRQPSKQNYLFFFTNSWYKKTE